MGCVKRWTYAVGVVFAFVFACGGKTQLLDGTNAGGSDGSSGRGGQGGDGSAGAGGAGARGGSLGASGSTGRGGAAGVGAAGVGAAGNGGSPGGRGGDGADGGTNSGGSAGSDAEAIIDAVCKAYETNNCPIYPGGTCRERLHEAHATYSLFGCGDEWADSEACVLKLPYPCGVSQVCQDARARFQKCFDDAYVCVRLNEAGGGCYIACETGWLAVCSPIEDGLLCTCQSGRRTGSQFKTVAPCQSPEWIAETRMECE